MSTPTFMVLATIRDDTDMAELQSLIPDEVAHIEQLRSEQRMGAVHIALTRRTIFIETFAADEAEAIATVRTLPMGKFFDLDVFDTMPPGGN